MPDVASEKEVEERLKFLLLLVEHCREDPISQAYLIRKLYDEYKKNSVKIPERIEAYLKSETSRIKDYLQAEIRKKKEILNELIRKKEELKKKQIEEEMKKKAEEKKQKLTRTQQIWGDEA